MKTSGERDGASEQRAFSFTERAAVLPFAEFDEEYLSDEVKRACLVCKNQGNNWSCPPFDASDVERVRNAFDAIEIIGYQTLLNGYAGSRSDCEAVERFKRDALHATRSAMTHSLLEAERMRPGTQALFPGSCTLCGPGGCMRAQGLPCANPSLMRPSLEAFGYDLGKLAKDLFDLDFCWASQGEIPSYYLLIGALLVPREIG